MFGIEQIPKTAKLRHIKGGYYYKIRDIDWDGILCTVDFDVINHRLEVWDIEEVSELTDNIISDILNLDYFSKLKLEKYDPNVCLKQLQGNIYTMDFFTEERHLHPIIPLKRYCSGNEVEILSGELKGKRGIYKAKLNDLAERGFIEVAEIDGHACDLQDIEFTFIDGNIQLSWESVMEE